MELQNIATRLEALGLDASEAEVYLRLLEAGPAKVRTLNTRVDASRSKLYRVLDDLCERGIATKSLTSPARYQACSPQTLFRKRRQALEVEQTRLDELEDRVLSSLAALQDRHTEPPEPHWQRVEGTHQIYETLCEALGDVDECLWAASNDEQCLQTRIPAIERAWSIVGQKARSGVDTRILLAPEALDSAGFEPVIPPDAIAFRELSVDRRLHFLVMDRESTFVWTRLPEADLARGEDPVALWTNAPGLSATQAVLFEELWAHADPLDQLGTVGR